MLYVWKLNPEDFVIPWTLNDNPEVSPHHEAYPNPTSDYLNVPLKDDDCQFVVVSIMDLGGCKFFERRFTEAAGMLKLDVSILENGVYFYEVVADGRRIQKGRFIKD